MSGTKIETVKYVRDLRMIFEATGSEAPIAVMEMPWASFDDQHAMGELIVKCYNEHAAAMSEVKRLRAFIASLNSISFEEWYGHYQSVLDDEFHIFDGEGNGVASGKNALEAYEMMNPNEQTNNPQDGGREAGE